MGPNPPPHDLIPGGSGAPIQVLALESTQSFTDLGDRQLPAVTQSDRPRLAGEGDEEFRLVASREQAMWQALETLGDEISDDEDRRQTESEQTRVRIEQLALGVSASVLALLARASSLTAMALSSLPFWQRADPLSVLALSRKERREREKVLSDAELQDAQSAGVGALTKPEELPDPDPTSRTEDEDEDETRDQE